MATTPENHPSNSAADNAAQQSLPQQPIQATPAPQANVPAAAQQQAPRYAQAAQPTVPLPGSVTAPGAPAPQAPSAPVQHAPQAPQYGAPQGAPLAGASMMGAPTPAPATAPVGGSYAQPAPNPGNGGFGPIDPDHDQAPAAERNNAQPKGRAGMLLAGLAIGALIGGVVGGGVAAVVSANGGQQVIAQGQNGTLTLEGGETTTAISGVATVATPSVVTLQVSGDGASGSGSGVIYSEDGYIITNAHVVTLDGAASESASIRVKLSDGRILDGALVGVDPYADLAVVKVEAEGLPAIKVGDSSELNVGDLTVAIGAPLNLANTVTSGVVSSLYRGISVGSPLIPQDPGNGQSDEGDGGFPWDFRFDQPDQGQGQPKQQQQPAGGSVTIAVIQTDASINPGNSGGALLNGKGELIGINVAIASPTSSEGVASSAGLGFAIPSNTVSRVADSIIAGEQPSHGLLGASVADSTQDTDADANHAGGLLVDIVKGGPADAAGLRAGDVVTAVNGVPAVDGTSVSALVRMNEGGSTVTIDYTRDGKAAQVEATLSNLEW